MKNRQKSAPQRLLWAQFDALQMGSGWDEEDITKPQILLEDVAAFTWRGLWNRQSTGYLKKEVFPPSTIPQISVTAALRAMTA